MIDFKALTAPFAAAEIEWRVQRSGFKKDGQPYIMVVPYLKTRAIMDRLDLVCGHDKWADEFVDWKAGTAQLCGIKIKIDREWLTKWDGSEDTDIKAVKGGIAGAFKRAAVKWGIGRYLGCLTEDFAIINNAGRYSSPVEDSSKKKHWFRWDPPAIPAEMLPAADAGSSKTADPAAAAVPVEQSHPDPAPDPNESQGASELNKIPLTDEQGKKFTSIIMKAGGDNALGYFRTHSMIPVDGNFHDLKPEHQHAVIDREGEFLRDVREWGAVEWNAGPREGELI